MFSWSALLRNKYFPKLSSLEAPFSREEIKRATFDLGADKALRPDGFPISFFQKYWYIIEKDILTLCVDFHNGSINLERINWASIALIPKNNSHEVSTNFRPISHINSGLKIMSKILASRLSKLIDSLTDKS